MKIELNPLEQEKVNNLAWIIHDNSSGGASHRVGTMF